MENKFPAARATEWLRAGQRAFAALPKAGKGLVVAAALAGPALAYTLAGGDDEPVAPADAAALGAPGGATGGEAGFLHSATAVLSKDIDRELEKLTRAGARATARIDPEQAEALDFDEALELLAERVEAAEGGEDLLDTLRDGDTADQPDLLLAHALPLMATGDTWGAVANLLVAQERDEDDATALVNLAAVANSQGLPAVALALLEEAEEREVADDAAPLGMREQAALLNNRGHALVLLGRHEDAEAPLREALAMNPEMSEAARNLVHVLLKQERQDEARALMPRAVWRLRGNPAKPVPVRSTEVTEAPAEPPPPAGSPEELQQWTEQPWLEETHGDLRLPLWVALDLSKRGQIAWPEILYPAADASYGGYGVRASARFLAAREKAAAIRQQMSAQFATQVGKAPTLGDTIQQIISTKISPMWSMEPIDTEMHVLDAGKERLLLLRGGAARFAELDAARAEYEMERHADRLYERYWRDSKCPVDSTTDECCGIKRREVERNIAEFTPYVLDYEEQMRVFFREAYGLSTAYASNLPPGFWHNLARLDIEQSVQNLHGHVQREVAFNYSRAAPAGSACYKDSGDADGAAPDVALDAPACSAASQWGSGKWSMSDAFSMEVTCGKIKFVAEVNIIGTRKVKLGPLKELGADLGMHAEVEISMEGTVTIFAGPKGGVSGKIGGVGGDFGVKDGIYAVIGREGVQDVGFRVVVGGGVGAGQGGGTHDVDSMDFSLVSAL
ncbi:MAG: tetratricopeptide repeat protein [Rhizobium sp.]|nr:tetratricopeptide repeat protein [Rhizobium sp.]